MTARRTKWTLAAYNRGGATVAQTVFSLRHLHEWARLEVIAAHTDSYRERWVAERDASAEAIRSLTT